MKTQTDQDPLTLEALISAIARSPIVVKHRAARLPDGFDDVDVAILEWIAAETLHRRRGVNLM